MILRERFLFLLNFFIINVSCTTYDVKGGLGWFSKRFRSPIGRPYESKRSFVSRKWVDFSSCPSFESERSFKGSSGFDEPILDDSHLR